MVSTVTQNMYYQVILEMVIFLIKIYNIYFTAVYLFEWNYEAKTIAVTVL